MWTHFTGKHKDMWYVQIIYLYSIRCFGQESRVADLYQANLPNKVRKVDWWRSVTVFFHFKLDRFWFCCSKFTSFKSDLDLMVNLGKCNFSWIWIQDDLYGRIASYPWCSTSVRGTRAISSFQKDSTKLSHETWKSIIISGNGNHGTSTSDITTAHSNMDSKYDNH